MVTLSSPQEMSPLLSDLRECLLLLYRFSYYITVVLVNLQTVDYLSTFVLVTFWQSKLSKSDSTAYVLLWVD